MLVRHGQDGEGVLGGLQGVGEQAPLGKEDGPSAHKRGKEMGALLGCQIVGSVEERGSESKERFRKIEITDIQRGIDTLAQHPGPAGREKQLQRGTFE